MVIRVVGGKVPISEIAVSSAGSRAKFTFSAIARRLLASGYLTDLTEGGTIPFIRR